jgi:hypothetical protein
MTKSDNGSHKRNLLKFDIWAVQRRMIHILLAAYAITAMISLATAWVEIGRLDKPKSMIKNIAIQTKKTVEIAKSPTPVIDQLPEFILQHETRGRQVIPGSKYPSAESIYENLDPNTMLQNPINTYAKATYYPSGPDARMSIDNSIKNRFSYANTSELIGSTIIKAGYDSKSGSYFMGWTKDNFAIELITSFLDTIPQNKGQKLRNHALPLARSIILGINRGGPPSDKNRTSNKTNNTQSKTGKSNE